LYARSARRPRADLVRSLRADCVAARPRVGCGRSLRSKSGRVLRSLRADCIAAHARSALSNKVVKGGIEVSLQSDLLGSFSVDDFERDTVDGGIKICFTHTNTVYVSPSDLQKKISLSFLCKAVNMCTNQLLEQQWQRRPQRALQTFLGAGDRADARRGSCEKPINIHIRNANCEVQL
jgi:hypothetical protein